MNSRMAHDILYNQHIAIDATGTRLQVGDTVQYTSGSKGTKMIGIVCANEPTGECIKVTIAKDPFPVYVSYKQLKKIAYKDNKEKERSVNMASTATKPSAKELRKRAKGLGIEGFEDLSLKELEAAVSEAESETEEEEVVEEAPRRKKSKKGSTKAAKANGKAKTNGQAKKRAKASEEADETSTTKPNTRSNPYRPGSNLWHVVEELKEGGTRDEIAKRILPKVKLYPRVNSGRSYEKAIVHARIMSTARALKKLGWKIERDGRGEEATITAVPPRR